MQCGYLLAFSLTLFVGLSHAQESLVLELSANTVTAGEQLNASCTAPASTTGRTLDINGVPVANFIMPANRLTSNASGVTTTWTIDPVEPGDAGMYVCVAGDQSPVMDSESQTVTVYFSPILEIAMPLENVVSGESVEIVISVDAVPGIMDTQIIAPSESAQQPMLTLTPGNVAVMFSSVNRYNNGMYTATFTNSIGSSMVEFQLTVYFGPIFSYGGMEQDDNVSITITFSEGDNVSIVCDVIASNPVVSSLMLTSSPNQINEEFVPETGTITITRATANNAGTYTCTASNGKTMSTINFELRMGMSSTGSPSETVPTTAGAGNLLATFSAAVVTLLAAILLL